MDAVAAVRAEKAEAKRRAAMWAALERKRGRRWSEEQETASRPVMPVGTSSMKWSPGRLRLGVEGLEGPEGPEVAEREKGVERNIATCCQPNLCPEDKTQEMT